MEGELGTEGTTGVFDHRATGDEEEEEEEEEGGTGKPTQITKDAFMSCFV